MDKQPPVPLYPSEYVSVAFIFKGGLLGNVL